jgi:hypothetical protein
MEDPTKVYGDLGSLGGYSDYYYYGTLTMVPMPMTMPMPMYYVL